MFLTNVWSRVKVFLPSGGKVPSRKRFLCGLVLLGMVFGGAGQARPQFMYWSETDNPGVIRRANLDGTGQTTLVSGLHSGPIGPVLDLAGGQMYWTNIYAGNIQRANLDGSGLTTIIEGLHEPGLTALDLVSRTIYFPEGVFGLPAAIRRANLDGTGLMTLISSGLNQPQAMALDLAGGQMYWVEMSGKIRRANLDGSGLTTLLQVGIPQAIALDIAGGKMYCTDLSAGEILRANLDGSGKEVLVRNNPNPAGIALDVAGGKMYWTNFFDGDIRRSNLDGTGQEILLTGLNGSINIALDLGAPGTAVFFAVAAPASVPSGTSFDITITALDPYGTTAVNYQGTVTFSTSDTDPGIVLPADYTFTTDDAGVHTFTGGVTLITPGDQTLTATDTASGITRSATVSVVPPG